MELQELVTKLALLDEDATIFVERPWSGTARARVEKLNEDLSVPLEVTNAGYVYFLDVDVAKEVLEVLADRGSVPGQNVRLLLYYAENDAYPGWVYGK